MRIKKNDTVYIRIGRDRGKTGKVIKVDLKSGTAIVEGINLWKKHVRPKRQGEKGEVVTLPKPIRLSVVAPYCSSCGRGSRVRYKASGGGRTRLCARCGSAL